MSEETKWYAVYTKPRWEKKVYRLLCDSGIKSYCPLHKVQRQWSDRKKIIEEPLFKSYVFVQVEQDEQTKVRMINGVVNFVYWLGKPAVIKNEEIETIKRFLNEYAEVEVKRLEIKPDSKVSIRSGAFMDKEGVVSKIYRKKVEVIIETIGCRLIAYIDKSNVSVV